jgi:hypothetical protein
MSVLNYPLTNGQIELMKLFNTNLTEEELTELKRLLSQYYAGKAMSASNVIWDEKGLDDAEMDLWLNSKSQ